MISNIVSLFTQITQRLENDPTGIDMGMIVGEIGYLFQVDSSAIGLNDLSLPSDRHYWHHDRGHGPSLPTAYQDWLTHPIVQQSLVQAQYCQVVTITLPLLESALAVSSYSLPANESNALAILMIKLGMASDAVVGIMYASPHQWSQAEIQSLELVAQYVAIVLSHSNKTRTIKVLQEQVHKATLRQTLLDRLIAAVRGSLELAEIQHMAVQGLGEILGLDRSLVLLVNYTDPLGQGRLSLKNVMPSPLASSPALAETGSDPRPALPLTNAGRSSIRIVKAADWQRYHQACSDTPPVSVLLSDCSVCQQAFAQPKDVIAIAELGASPHVDLPIADFFQTDQWPAIAVVALESRGTILGFLAVQHSQPRSWHPTDLTLLEDVSVQLSMAIIQLQTLRQVRAMVEERTVQLGHSLDVQAKLYEVTRRQVAKLQSLDKIKDNFLNTISHELRTPLTSMFLAIRMLRQVGLSAQQYTHYLNILEECCHQEVGLVNDLLTLQELESDRYEPPQAKWVDLKALVEALVVTFQEKWQANGISLVATLPDRLALQANQEDLRRVLVELLTNAGKYSFPQTTVSLQARLVSDHEQRSVIITICNDGLGLSDIELKDIFGKFRRGINASQRSIQGAGLGLALVKGLVNFMQGTILVTSEPSDQADAGMAPMYKTCLTIQLPQYTQEP